MIRLRSTLSITVKPRHIILLLIASCMLAGCVRRTVRISTEPSGALVWLNHREIGRTPVEVDFTHYGTYDLMIRKHGWEPMIGAMPMGLSVYGTPGIDLLLEVSPVGGHHVIDWHVDLVPRDSDHAALIDRADEMRRLARGHDPLAMSDETARDTEAAPKSDK